MVGSSPVPSNYKAALSPDLNGLTSPEILAKVIAYAGRIGPHVILDDHRSEAGNGAEDNGLWYTSADPRSAWIDDWVAMVTRCNGNATVIGVDLREVLVAEWRGRLRPAGLHLRFAPTPIGTSTSTRTPTPTVTLTSSPAPSSTATAAPTPLSHSEAGSLLHCQRNDD